MQGNLLYAFDNVQPRRTYKDTVFRDLFGKEERKQNALSLYNALAQTSYEDACDLELTTIDDAIYMTHKNDVSFLIDDHMVLMEEQSTKSKNMALRALVYVAQLYTKYVESRGLNPYGSRRIMLPTPHIYVFYLGTDGEPEREEQLLSSSFANGPGDVEVHVHVVNVREGKNTALMEACEALAGYAHLVRLVEDNRRAIGLGAAIHRAVERCVAEGYLVDYLTDRMAEVEGMLLTEYDEAATMELLRKEALEDGYNDGYAAGWDEGRDEGRKEGRKKGLDEGRDEGRKEGRDEGRKEGRDEGMRQSRLEFLERAVDAVRDHGLSIAEAATLFGFDEREIEERLGA